MTGAAARCTNTLVAGLLPLAQAASVRRLQRVGDVLGDALFVCLRAHRRVVDRNLRIAFGDRLDAAGRRAIARQTFRNMAKSALEFAKMPALSPDELRTVTKMEGAEHLDAALKSGGGLVYYTAHFGNWELMGARLCLDGYPLTVIARELHNSYVNDVVNRVRSKVGMKVLTHGSAIRNAIRTLRANEMVGILADQDAGPGALFVPFLGTPAACVAGPAQIARRTGCPVIPAFDLREDDGRHTIKILPPLGLESTDDTDADAWENTRRMSACLERMILSHPDQWFWLHKRWRTRPPGDDRDFYGSRRDGGR
jgi:KDO2-lipid IV(A) lauroyltransferase